jgi:hypothetical protein
VAISFSWNSQLDPINPSATIDSAVREVVWMMP